MAAYRYLGRKPLDPCTVKSERRVSQARDVRLSLAKDNADRRVHVDSWTGDRVVFVDEHGDGDRSSGSNGSSGNSSRSSSNSIFTTRKSRGSTMPQRQNSTTPLVDGGGMDEEEEEEERSVASLSLTNLFRRYQYGQKKE